MKNFDEFRKSVLNNGDSIHKEIFERFEKTLADISFDSIGDEKIYKERSYIYQSIMVFLERYHEWLNSDG